MKVLLATVSRRRTLEAQLQRHRPDAVVVICTRASAGPAAEALDSFKSLDPSGTFGWVSVLIEGELTPERDIRLCALAACQGVTHARRLLGEGELLVDISGGTRPMALGLWSACPTEIQPVYLEIPPEGGDPISKAAGSASPPVQRIADARVVRNTLERISALVRLGYFQGAAELAQEAGARFADLETHDPQHSRRLGSMCRVTHSLARWEVCDFAGAAHRLKCDFRKILPCDAHPGLEAAIAGLRRWLAFVRTPRLPYLDPQGAPLPLDVEAFGHDCLLAARRLAGQGQFDFAVLKLYRAIEARLQAEFARLFGGRSNSGFPVGLLPPHCRAAWEAETQTANLGLERTLRVLEAAGSPLPGRFVRLSSLERGPVSFHTQSVRNHGPMTHGFLPITAEKYQLCLKETESLLDPPLVAPPDWEALGSYLHLAT